MQVFGITINKITLPLIYLACSIVGYIFLLESFEIFQSAISARAISITLQAGFILLSLPAIYSLNKIDIPRQAIILAFIWLMIALISTLLGDHPWAAMVRWFELFSVIITTFCLYLLISQQPKLISLIARAVMTSLIICITIFSAFWYLLSDPIIHNWAGDLPIFINIRHFGYLVAAALPLGYWLLETKSLEKNSKYSALLFLTLCWALVFWLGGRGTFLGVLAATILYCALSRQQIKWVISCIILGLLLSQLFIVDHPSLSLFRILDLFINSEASNINSVSSSRMIIYQESLLYWWSNTPYLGTGADGFRYITPPIGGVEGIAHPHSVVIQLLLSYGAIGLLIPSAFFLLLSWKFLQIKNKLQKTFYLSVISTIILSIFDGVFYHAYGLFIATIIIGIATSIAWPQPLNTNSKDSTSNKNPVLASLLMLSALLSLIYCSLFIYQLYSSKYGCVDKNWINWNAQYPLYFSPTLNYERYSLDDIEELKAIYLKNKQDDCLLK